MPTRIVLEDAPRSPQFAPHTLRRPRGEQTEHGAPPRRRALAASSSLALAGDGNDSPPTSNSRAGEFGQVPESKRGAYIGFRSSVLRELAVRSSDETTVASAPPVEEERLTSDDIRASPRFVGYVFSMIAASVMLVSAVQFYRQDTLVQEELPEVDNDKFFVTTGGALVYRWKLWGAVYAGSVGVGLSLFILVAHFDTICLPRLWMHVFRDGSLIERNLIFFLLAFWAATLHVCTSSLSIGEHVGNVFFTTWIAFASIALNYGVWRESAGLPSVAEHVSGMSRETTYNWIWIGIFSAVFAGASTDLYRNREDVELRYQGEVLELDEDNWMLVLAIVWTEVTVCILAVIFNESIIDTWHIPFTVRQGRYACGWRQLEGLIMLAGVGAKFWVIVEYSGVAGVVNGLSNAYFGLWGTFFNSVFGLGTWLRENKRFEYIRRDDADSARANE